eukprot:SAG31_NODE_9287_length_1304_cov_1.205809_1_plen_104_part_10
MWFGIAGNSGLLCPTHCRLRRHPSNAQKACLLHGKATPIVQKGQVISTQIDNILNSLANVLPMDTFTLFISASLDRLAKYCRRCRLSTVANGPDRSAFSCLMIH